MPWVSEFAAYLDRFFKQDIEPLFQHIFLSDPVVLNILIPRFQRRRLGPHWRGRDRMHDMLTFFAPGGPVRLTLCRHWLFSTPGTRFMVNSVWHDFLLSGFVVTLHGGQVIGC